MDLDFIHRKDDDSINNNSFNFGKLRKISF
jgi:hypothetical protein